VNEFFRALGRRWSDVASKRGARIAEPELDPAVAEELLQFSRVVAHSKERSFAPLASYLAGVAAERFRVAQGADGARIAEFIREVREALEREMPKTEAPTERGPSKTDG
jgi:hypothetical protein